MNWRHPAVMLARGKRPSEPSGLFPPVPLRITNFKPLATAVIAKIRDSKITIFQQGTRFLTQKRPQLSNTCTRNDSPQETVTSASALRTLLSRQNRR